MKTPLPTKEEFEAYANDPKVQEEFKHTLEKAKLVAKDLAQWANDKEIKPVLFHIAVTIIKDVLDEEIGVREFKTILEG